MRQKNRVPYLAGWLIVSLINLGLLVWLGLRRPAKSFPAWPERPIEPPAPAPWPEHLPEPVRRAFGAVLPHGPQTITSAVISGRATLRIGALTLPARFRFIHEAGHSYRHLIDVTWFGHPVLRVDESFVDGYARMNLGPMGQFEGTPMLKQAANLALWAEAIWFPSALITDSRLRWEPIDDLHARLFVPLGEGGEDVLLVTFEEITGRIRQIDALRYRDAHDRAQKLGWRCTPEAYFRFYSTDVPVQASVTWSDQSAAWAEWTVEDVVYNVDVREALRA